MELVQKISNITSDIRPLVLENDVKALNVNILNYSLTVREINKALSDINLDKEFHPKAIYALLSENRSKAKLFSQHFDAGLSVVHINSTNYSCLGHNYHFYLISDGSVLITMEPEHSEYNYTYFGFIGEPDTYLKYVKVLKLTSRNFIEEPFILNGFFNDEKTWVKNRNPELWYHSDNDRADYAISKHKEGDSSVIKQIVFDSLLKGADEMFNNPGEQPSYDKDYKRVNDYLRSIDDEYEQRLSELTRQVIITKQTLDNLVK